MPERRMNEQHCPQAHLHTPQPELYLQRQAWARRMMKTHRQEQCPGCGRWVIWVSKAEQERG